MGYMQMLCKRGLAHPQTLPSALERRCGEKWMALNSILEPEAVGPGHIWGLKEGQRSQGVSDLY